MTILGWKKIEKWGIYKHVAHAQGHGTRDCSTPQLSIPLAIAEMGRSEHFIKLCRKQFNTVSITTVTNGKSVCDN